MRARDVNADTPLHVASAAGQSDVLRLLLEAGVDGPEIDMEGANGRSPLLQACSLGAVDTSRQLIEATADINRASHVEHTSASTPLLAACAHGQPQVASLLIQMRANLNQPDEAGRSPLLVACTIENLEVARLLVAAGARKGRGHAPSAPLHVAVLLDNADMAHLLLQNRADINEKTADGDTALWRASLMGSTDMVRLLIQHGSSQVVDNEGRTPLLAARYFNYADIEQLLLERAPKRRRRTKGPP